MSITKQQAESLAVRYHGYLSAQDDNSIAVWGDMLIEIQNETGIVLANPANIADLVAGARRRKGTRLEVRR